MSSVLVIQARMGSTRLPGKVLMDIGGRSVLDLVVTRLRRADIDTIVVATSNAEPDDAIARACDHLDVACVRGAEDDVLYRFTTAVDQFPADDVVRITADCPLIDPKVVDDALRLHRLEGADYTSNTLVRTYPDGLDVEVVRRSVLDIASSEANRIEEREHVTPFVYRQPHRFAVRQLTGGQPRLGRERWTLDTVDDLARVREIANMLPSPVEASWIEILGTVGTSAVFAAVDVVPDLECVTDMTERHWHIVSADEVVGYASVCVTADGGLLALECSPHVRSAARESVERALRADLQISHIFEEDE
jgi:spore coat polysaccharide biosynthesis protein SpsF